MRIVAFEKAGGTAIGVREGETVVDLSIAAPQLPQTLRGLLADGLLSAVQDAATGAGADARLNFDELALLPPIPDPPKILCVGRNYAEHAKEGDAEVPAYPDIFMRYAGVVAECREWVVFEC